MINSPTSYGYCLFNTSKKTGESEHFYFISGKFSLFIGSYENGQKPFQFANKATGVKQAVMLNTVA